MWRWRRRRRGRQAEPWAAGVVPKQLAVYATRFWTAHEHAECVVIHRIRRRPHASDAPEALVAPSILHVAVCVEALNAVEDR